MRIPIVDIARARTLWYGTKLVRWKDGEVVYVFEVGGDPGGGRQQQNWDAHHGVEENLKIHGPEIDRPVAGLLEDLERRGLLDETLVVWGGEFGRQAVSEGDNGGRDRVSHAVSSVASEIS